MGIISHSKCCSKLNPKNGLWRISPGQRITWAYRQSMSRSQVWNQTSLGPGLNIYRKPMLFRQNSVRCPLSSSALQNCCDGAIIFKCPTETYRNYHGFCVFFAHRRKGFCRSPSQPPMVSRRSAALGCLVYQHLSRWGPVWSLKQTRKATFLNTKTLRNDEEWSISHFQVD